MLIEQGDDFEELPNFAYRQLDGLRLRGKALKTMAEFIALTELRLFDAAITNAGSKHFSTMLNLPYLVLLDTNVTASPERSWSEPGLSRAF